MEPAEIILIVVGAGRRGQAPAPVVPDDVIDDRPGFGDGAAVVGYDRGFAERVDLLELRRRQVRDGIAPVMCNCIVDTELFEQPQDALRARLVEVMEGNHPA